MIKEKWLKDYITELIVDKMTSEALIDDLLERIERLERELEKERGKKYE